jgi:glycosyltransferase involved in cell wall biosynthesis
VRFWIVGGEGNFDVQPLYRLASPLTERGILTFLGPYEDVHALLEQIDMLVLPSLSEGLPYILLEALAHKKPVVATSVGGTPEVIRHGHTGLLVPPRDSAALAQAIAQLLADPDAGRQLGERGQQLVLERFTIQQMLQSTEALYDELLRGAPMDGSPLPGV